MRKTSAPGTSSSGFDWEARDDSLPKKQDGRLFPEYLLYCEGLECARVQAVLSPACGARTVEGHASCLNREREEISALPVRQERSLTTREACGLSVLHKVTDLEDRTRHQNHDREHKDELHHDAA